MDPINRLKALVIMTIGIPACVAVNATIVTALDYSYIADDPLMRTSRDVVGGVVFFVLCSAVLGISIRGWRRRDQSEDLLLELIAKAVPVLFVLGGIFGAYMSYSIFSKRGNFESLTRENALSDCHRKLSFLEPEDSPQMKACMAIALECRRTHRRIANSHDEYHMSSKICLGKQFRAKR